MVAGTDVAAIHNIIQRDADRSLSPDAKLVQTKVEAGHESNTLIQGPAFRLLGLDQTNYNHIYNKEEPLDQFKPRLVTHVSDGAILPATTAEVEREALREAVQVAVDTCEIPAAAPSIADRRANLAKLEEMAKDDKNHDKRQAWWSAKANSLDVAVNNRNFKPVGGSKIGGGGGPKKKDGWALAVKNLVTQKRADLKEEEEDEEKSTAAKAAHAAAALAVYKAAHEAAAKFEKVQLEKARDAGGSALRDRLWARAEAMADANRERAVNRGTTSHLAGFTAKAGAKGVQANKKNMWTRHKYDTSQHAKNNNYAGYCEKGRGPAGCYEPVNYLEYCASLPVSKDFKFQLDEDGELDL